MVGFAARWYCDREREKLNRRTGERERERETEEYITNRTGERERERERERTVPSILVLIIFFFVRNVWPGAARELSRAEHLDQW
jgi:hypothetical protein